MNNKTKLKNSNKNKMPLAKWEENAGGKLCIEHMKSWILENKLKPAEVHALVSEFRDKVIAGGNEYADFPAAFKVWLRSGYLSKKLDDVKIPKTADPKFKVFDVGTPL